MRERLTTLLLQYVKQNNPDLLYQMESETVLLEWLAKKISCVSGMWEQMKRKRQPDVMVEEACMEELTKDLRPSRFHYINNILEAEFSADHSRMLNSGVLRYEIINLVNRCQSTFDDLRFAEENEDNRFTRYAITGVIRDYLLDNSVNELVSDALQQPAEV